MPQGSSADMDEFRLTEEYCLRALDVDINGLWMPSAIFTRMQEVAENHAQAVGRGRCDIVKDNLAWVLTRMHLRMDRYPCLGETIRISTWPLRPASLLFRRQFLFENLDGSVLGRASSQWALLNLEKRSLCRTSVLGEYPYDPESRTVLEEPRKITLPEDMAEAAVRKVLYSDVDMNAHMNNSKYLNWICELFPIDFLRANSLRDAYINYIAEAYIGDDVSLDMQEDKGSYFICGRTAGRTVFDAQVTWGRRSGAWQKESAF